MMVGVQSASTVCMGCNASHPRGKASWLGARESCRAARKATTISAVGAVGPLGPMVAGRGLRRGRSGFVVRAPEYALAFRARTAGRKITHC
eukprot:6484663-Alexandrium_andersonii.AAC.1